MKSKPVKPCPVCRQTDQVIPIIYGLPPWELGQKAGEGKVRLGGCIVFPDNPEWYCKRDDIKF